MIAKTIAARLRRALAAIEPSKLDKIRGYQNDPVGFARDILGIRLWEGQRRILEAALHNKKVAIVSGHKIGKSTALAVLALWFYCSFPGARVVITAVTDRQVNGIIWLEIRKLVRMAAVRGFDIPGGKDIHLLARNGLKDPEDFSEITGFTSKEVEAVAGVSAAYLLYLCDESSGIPDKLFMGIKGNMMGGGRIVLISNPTKSTGEFAEAFLNESKGYKTLQISSLETPNCTGLEEPIPGLAEPETIAEVEREWGKDSAAYKIRVEGRFVIEEEGKAFSFELISACQLLWEANGVNEPEGRLVIAIDPAGESGEGDESVFAVRRGPRLMHLFATRGLSDEGHLLHAQQLAEQFHKESDSQDPVLMIDREGPIGARLFNEARAQLGGKFLVIGVRVSEKAVRQPQVFETKRDELLGNLRDLARAGELELLADKKLERELNAPSFVASGKGRFKATPKKEIKKAIGRSPDRYDAVAMAFWYIDRSLMGEQGASEDEGRVDGSVEDIDPFDAIDAGNPYDALDAWSS